MISVEASIFKTKWNKENSQFLSVTLFSVKEINDYVGKYYHLLLN